jgi:hypothetical protein
MMCEGLGRGSADGAARTEQKKNDGVGTPSAEDIVFLPSRSPGRSQRHRKNCAIGWFQKRSRP